MLVCCSRSCPLTSVKLSNNGLFGWEDAAQRRHDWLSSTFRITCGDDGFHQDSLDFLHLSSTGALYCARTKVPRVSHNGDNFAGMSSVLDKCLFRKIPNSRSGDDFSEHLQIVLFTLRDPELNAVYNTTVDVYTCRVCLR